MQTTIQIGALIGNPDLSDQVSRICAAQGWTVWLSGALDARPTAAAESADIVIFDQLELQPRITDILIKNRKAHAVFIGTAPAIGDLPARCSYLAAEDLEANLVPTITTALNIARFETQFFKAQQAEPITKLPHHPELLEFMSRFQGDAVGLIVVQIDHAEHLYGNLDPVSKTDLLGALSDHLNQNLPHSTYMGIYDAGSFAIWCPGMQAEEVKSTAHALCVRGREPLMFRGGQLHFSVSAGFAFNHILSNPQHLWQQAWAAKEQAIENGGNCVAGAQAEAEIGARIPSALSRDEFGLVLQPQWDIRGETMKGVESLLRWQGLEVGTIAPDHFIPIAERNGQMARVGDWVLERACSESAAWFEHLVAPIILGVNVSPQQFANDAIGAQIMRLTLEEWLDPGILELEMSHDNLLHVVDQHRASLFQLRDSGVRIAIDNLGVGIVDTNKLLRCPADTLKIDRSLVARMEHDPSAHILVEQICQVGDRFQLRVVAVGVETETQRRLLENLGCTEAQGYLFSAPIPLRDFQRYLSDTHSEQADIVAT